MIKLLQAIDVRIKGLNSRSQPEGVDSRMDTVGARLWLWRGCGFGEADFTQASESGWDFRRGTVPPGAEFGSFGRIDPGANLTALREAEKQLADVNQMQSCSSSETQAVFSVYPEVSILQVPRAVIVGWRYR
jgi:hypothetical protein